MADCKDECKKAKGISKRVVKNRITHDDYLDCLFSGKEQYRTMNVIRSCKHDIYSERVNKIALSGADDKRVILQDGISTFALGNWRLNDLNITK